MSLRDAPCFSPELPRGGNRGLPALHERRARRVVHRAARRSCPPARSGTAPAVLPHARGQAPRRRLPRGPWSPLLRGRTSGMPRMSAWNCMRNPFTDAPPSTRTDFKRPARIRLHGVHEVPGLVGDALQRGAHDVLLAGAARDAEQRAARIGVPVGGAQADERRDEVHPARVRHGAGEDLRFRRGGQDAQLVAKPLHHRAADEHRSLQRVLQAVAEVPCHRGEEPVAGGHGVPSRGQEAEAPRAVGHLHHPRLEARLSQQGGLLVAQHTAHGDLGAQEAARGQCRNRTLTECTSGSMARGMPSAERICTSHRPSWMSNSRVRDAFDGSVRWRPGQHCAPARSPPCRSTPHPPAPARAGPGRSPAPT